MLVACGKAVRCEGRFPPGSENQATVGTIATYQTVQLCAIIPVIAEQSSMRMI